MEIFTLLKANIRHKKGSFVSIMILMLIISMSFTAIFSIKDNCINSIQAAQELANTADLTIIVNHNVLTDELLASVEKHASVKAMSVKEAINAFNAEHGDIQDTSPWFMVRLTDEYRLLNEQLSDYADEAPALQKGEIYVSQGAGTKLGCGIGDTLKVNTAGGVEEFTIKGFVVEPTCGAMPMGIKQVFISDEDFSRLQENAANQQQGDFRIIQLHKADENVSEGQFKHQLNEDTGIVNYCFFSFTKEQSFFYTNIYPDIILSVLLVFVGFLVGVVLIVMTHSISTSIEMEYTSLGVLKAQGFTEGKIRLMFAFQYLIAQMIGAAAGVLLALPLIKAFGGIFQPILAVPGKNNVSVLASMLFVLAVLAVSAIFIFIITRKVGKVSPMKAISGAKDDVYFGSRANAPISPKALSSSLAFRQFTSNKRRYIGTVIIVVILMFFMITMSVLGTSMDSDSSMESMGFHVFEVSVTANESLSDEIVKDIENIIQSHTEINNKYYFDSIRMAINGEEYSCVVHKMPETMIMEAGRYPQYDNEIAVTDLLAKELDLKIGDKVTVSMGSHDLECIITGVHIDVSELGLNFSMPLATSQNLGIEDTLFYGFNIADTAACSAIAEELNAKYADILTVATNEVDPNLEMYAVARNAMTAIIYVISIVFSLVVVMMVCKKAFLQERRDIGIYKSLGFTSAKLRLQFAVRFLIVSLIGSALGTVLSFLFTEKVLTLVFRLLGISSFNAQFTFISFAVPVAIIAVSFFSFAYLASSKIKTVEIKELVIE